VVVAWEPEEEQEQEKAREMVQVKDQGKAQEMVQVKEQARVLVGAAVKVEAAHALSQAAFLATSRDACKQLRHK
jgi:hypothetical protein